MVFALTIIHGKAEGEGLLILGLGFRGGVWFPGVVL
jgi:hypothetical protein